MRRIIQGGIIVLLGVMTAGLPITAEGVWAADNGRGNAKWETTEERVLPVRIKRDDGIEITPRDKEYVNTDMGLTFEMNDGVIEELFDHKRGKITEYETEDGLIRARAGLQYAISRDRGMTYEEWKSIEGAALHVSPEEYGDGEYCIRFRKLQEYILDDDKAEALRISDAEYYAREADTDDDVRDEKDAEDPQSGSNETESSEEGVPEEEEKDTGDGSDAVTAEETDAAGYEEDKSSDNEASDKEGADTEREDTEASDEAGEDEEKEYRISAEERISRAEAIIFAEGIHVIESLVYYVNLDTTSPALLLNADVDDGEWTNRGVKCSVVINDTGSRPAWIRITYDNNRITEESFSQDMSLSGTEKEFCLNSESSSYEGGELVVEAADRAGNRTRISRMIGIDRTAPEISLRGAEEGRIYDRPVSVSISGDDMFPDSVCVGYTVKRIINGAEETAESSARTLSECNEGVLYTADTDGDYIIECHARDRAGNTSKTLRRSFRVDTIRPALKLEGVSDTAVLGNDASLKITACDNYNDGYKVSLKGNMKNASGNRELKLADFKTEGLISTNTYYFKTDGDYDISVTVTDSAGNTCEDRLSFSIDKTAPEITLLGALNTNDELVTNEPPTVRFRVDENNYRNTLVSYELKSVGSKTKKNDRTSGEWIMNDMSDEYSVQIEEEGSYELKLNAVDEAGNVSCKTVRFTLDMTGPQIDYVDNLNKKYIKSFKLPENFNEYIKDQGEVSYRTYLNSRNYDESEQIEEDGKYVLKVSAVDDAGNQTEKTVEFIVDGTLPRVVVDGMSDDGSVNKDEVIVLSLYDEGDYFRSVRLNGEEVLSGDRQETVEITIPEYGDYTIEIEASDMADNILTQTIEAKCANASPVEKGVSTVRTLKRSDKSGNDKGLRIFLIVMTVLVLAGSIAVFTIYNIKTGEN